MYALYQVKVWIKAEIESGTPLEKVMQNLDKIPPNNVDFVESEDYLTETEEFILPEKEATLKIVADNGLTIYTNKKRIIMPTTVKQCDCKGTPATEFQDKTYGKGLRLFNECKEGKQAKCTCCGKTINK